MSIIVSQPLKTGVNIEKELSHCKNKLSFDVTSHLIRITGIDLSEVGQDYYEQKYRNRFIKNLRLRAKELGFNMVELIC